MANGPYIGTQTPAKKKGYTADQIAASLAANPQASSGGYEGSAPVGAPPIFTPAGSSTPRAGGAASNPFATDPGYMAALAAEQTGSQQADAALRAAQEAAIVGYGDPSLAAALGFQVSDNTQAAARANYLSGNSTLSRLDKQKGLAEQGNINNLAAHGIINSGELGYQQGQIGQGYGNAVYDAQQQLLSGLGAAGAQNVAAKQNLHSGTVGALTSAYSNFVANPGLYGAATAGSPVAAQLGKSSASSAGSAPLSRLAGARRVR